MVKYPSGSLAAFRKPVTKKDEHPVHRSYHHKKGVNFSDRGMTLEQQINESNKYYLMEEIAVVHKSQPQFKLLKLIIPNVLRRSFVKLTLGKLQQLTIMVFIKDTISILRQKKHGIKLTSH